MDVEVTSIVIAGMLSILALGFVGRFVGRRFGVTTPIYDFFEQRPIVYYAGVTFYAVFIWYLLFDQVWLALFGGAAVLVVSLAAYRIGVGPGAGRGGRQPDHS